jgi:DNA-binding transcriptional ArsR family regulator
MARPRTAKPRSLRHAALGQALELVIAEDADMTLDTVARDSGLDEKQIGTFIRGQGNPTYSTLLKLCDGLHVSLATLTLRAEELHEKRRGHWGLSTPRGNARIYQLVFNQIVDQPKGWIRMALDELSVTFAALADPTRRAILARLAQEGEVTVNDLAKPFPVTLQAVSRHLKVLERAGLITRARSVNVARLTWRPSHSLSSVLYVGLPW